MLVSQYQTLKNSIHTKWVMKKTMLKDGNSIHLINKKHNICYKDYKEVINMN